MIKKYFIY